MTFDLNNNNNNNNNKTVLKPKNNADDLIESIRLLSYSTKFFTYTP